MNSAQKGHLRCSPGTCLLIMKITKATPATRKRRISKCLGWIRSSIMLVCLPNPFTHCSPAVTGRISLKGFSKRPICGHSSGWAHRRGAGADWPRVHDLPLPGGPPQHYLTSPPRRPRGSEQAFQNIGSRDGCQHRDGRPGGLGVQDDSRDWWRRFGPSSSRRGVRNCRLHRQPWRRLL
jgi:hypothetical protein